MKHKFLYILFIPFITLLIPITVSFCFSSATAVQITGSSPPKSLTISVFNTEKNTTSDIDLEEYLIGVLAAEMPASYEMEALKAQAVAARSYILFRASSPTNEHPNAAVCDNPNHCKAHLTAEELQKKWGEDNRDFYIKKITNAVNSTAGEYMVYEDEAIEAFFFAGSGGRTESSEDVWGGERPYLKSVVSEGDIHSPNYKSSVTVSTANFWESLTAFNPQTKPNPGIPVIGAISRTEGGSVKEISLGGQVFRGSEIRSIFGLKSANFSIITSENGVYFNVLGYGHGVGMSQFGANYMAQNGKNYTEILSHYYTNIQIIKN